jgi:hypothetical protein
MTDFRLPGFSSRRSPSSFLPPTCLNMITLFQGLLWPCLEAHPPLLAHKMTIELNKEPEKENIQMYGQIK